MAIYFLALATVETLPNHLCFMHLKDMSTPSARAKSSRLVIEEEAGILPSKFKATETFISNSRTKVYEQGMEQNALNMMSC